MGTSLTAASTASHPLPRQKVRCPETKDVTKFKVLCTLTSRSVEEDRATVPEEG